MGKKSRKRPDRKKKDAAAATAAAAGKQPNEAARQDAIGELFRAADAKEPGAEERLKKYIDSLPEDVFESAMKASRDSAAEKRGLTPFVSPTLRCADCKTDHFSQPANLCLFCPECPNAQCGDCGDSVGALGPFMVCPKCRVMVCFDHAMRLMEDNGTRDGCLAMSCRDCGTAERRSDSPSRVGRAPKRSFPRARPRPSWSRPPPRLPPWPPPRGSDASATSAASAANSFATRAGCADIAARPARQLTGSGTSPPARASCK